MLHNITSVAIIGAGTMGNGIAHVCAQHGRRVTLIDLSEQLLHRGLETIAKNLGRQVAREVLTRDEADATLGRIYTTNELEGYDRERAFKQAEGIYDTLMEIFKMSAEEGIPTNVASDHLAENRIRSVAKFKTCYTSTPRRVFRRG